MDAAVDHVIAMKYGPGGTYDPAVLELGYADKGAASKYLAHAERYDDRAVAYVKEICNYIFDTYGRFPAHVDAWHVPGTWLQVSHPELEYYAQTVPPAFFERQRAHASMWSE